MGDKFGLLDEGYYRGEILDAAMEMSRRARPASS